MDRHSPWYRSILSWFGRHDRRVVDGIRSAEDIRSIFDRERARADRNNGEFSVAVFFLGARSSRTDAILIRILRDRIRATDEIGWLDENRIGVVLPETSRDGATRLADDACRRTEERLGVSETGATVRFEVYSYPPASPFADITEGDASSETDTGTPAAIMDVDACARSGRPEQLEVLVPPAAPRWKRAMDICGAVIGLTILAPLFGVIAVVIKLSSRGPVFFKHTRIGYRGRPFTCLKFRTMHVRSDTRVHRRYFRRLIINDEPMRKLDGGDDPRIIPFGAILRASAMDELPQLINVLRGEMSLIGPRPCMPYEAVDYLNWQHRRFDCMPGLTGLWQVSGKNRTTFKTMIRLDIRYARRLSPVRDLGILVKTVPTVIGQLRERASMQRSSGHAETA